MANIETSGKTRILLTKSAIPNKLPDTSGMTYGEVFVNYASGIGKSFLSTKKNDDTLAQFMEKSYNDGAYADKGDYEKFKSDVEGTYATVDALSALTDNVIKNEYVVAHAINTINQSAGFDENGNSTLGMSLTDAIKELQENGGNFSEIQGEINGIKSDVEELSGATMSFSGSVANKFAGYYTSAQTDTEIVTAKDQAISSGKSYTDAKVNSATSVFNNEIEEVKSGFDNLSSSLSALSGTLVTDYATSAAVNTIISALTEEIIDNELVTSTSITKINESAGFDENGNSTIGKSLTDAIVELQSFKSDTGHTHNYLPTSGGTVNGNITATKFIGALEGNADSATTATIADKVKNNLIVGTKTYNGSGAITITAEDLGLASALKYHGKTTTALTDGATTNPITINNASHTATTGCVVIDNNSKKEFVWNGSNWEELGDESSWKIKQSAVADPSANGSGLTFIATITQDANGVITPTKKSVNLSSYSLTSHTHDDRYYTESEMNTKLAAKSDTGHTHVASNITGGTFDIARIPTGTTSSTVARGDHSHNSLLVNGTDDNTTYGNYMGILQSPNIEGMASGKWFNVIKILHPNSQGYYTELAQAFTGTEGLYHRRMEGGLKSAWRHVLDSSNYSEYCAPKSHTHSEYLSSSKAITHDTGTTRYLMGVSTTATTTLGSASIYTSSKVYSNGSNLYATSDETLKDFISDIDCDLEALSKLPKKYFTWKGDESKTVEIGTSAQKVKELYPEMVTVDPNEKLGVAYDKLSVVALAAIDKLYAMYKESQEEIKELKSRIEELEK